MTMELRFNARPLPPEDEPIFYGPTAPFSDAQGPQTNLFDIDRLPDGSYTCESMRCLWPCRHHRHPSDRGGVPGIEVPYRIVLTAAKQGCLPCQALVTVADSRCHCRLVQDTGDVGDYHQCVEIRMYWHAQTQYTWDSIISLVVIEWDCGESNFDLCTPAKAQDDVFPLRPVFGTINRNPRDPMAIALCKKWLIDCRTTHEECPGAANTPLPTRVLDVSSSTLTGDIKLYSSTGENEMYLALSYCWGGVVPLRTTLHNLEYHLKGIPWADLAPTFKDCVVLARLLEIRYVWIDALCIIQDSADDWTRESARMASVYSNADLVIIAANAPSVSAGFLHPRQRHLWDDIKVSQPSASPAIMRVREAIEHTPNTDPGSRLAISGRGWCLQERVMGKRRLIFQEREFVWECRHGHRCECSSEELGYSSLPRYQHRGHMLPSDYQSTANGDPHQVFETNAHAYDFWRDAVQEYTERKVTVPSDRLPAVSAIARVIQEQTQDEYLAGLWKADLLHGLMWHANPSTHHASDSGTYVAPSWSWAQQPQIPVYYVPVLEEYRKENTDPKHYWSVKLVDHGVSLTGANALGSVTGGHLILTSYYSDVTLVTRLNPRSGTKVAVQGISHNFADVFQVFDHRPVSVATASAASGQPVQTLTRSNTWQRINFIKGRVRLLWLLPNMCLILGYSTRERGAFERLGLVSRFFGRYETLVLSMLKPETVGGQLEYGETKLI